jgi:predicted aspartyl protease
MSNRSRFAPAQRAVRALAFIALCVACGTAAAASNCKLARIAEWQVRLEQGRVLLDGAINGQKIDIMIDTGAASTLIFRETSERLSLPLREAKNMRMFGVGGETKVFVAHVDEFRLGDALRNNWNVYVTGSGLHGADVILGEDFFASVDVEFDLAHRAVRLYQPKDCEGVSLAYWATKGVGMVELEAISIGHPQISMPVEINGRKIMATLDTGAPTSILEKADAARMGVTPESPGVIVAGHTGGLGGKVADTWLGTFKTFTIGSETIRDAEIPFADVFKETAFTETGSHVPTKVQGMSSMLLGLDFLMAHRVLVAHSQSKAYFTYTGDPIFQSAQQPAAPNATAPEGSALVKPKGE